MAVPGFTPIASRQVLASAIMLGVMGFFVTGYSIFAVAFAQEFKPSRMMLMMAITVMSIVTAILSPFLGNLIDRMPLKRLMFLGVVCVTAGLLALSLTTSIFQVLVIYGLLLAPVNVLMGPIAITVLLSRWFVERRGRAIGIAMVCMSLLSMCLPPFIQWLLDAYHWRTGMRLLALVLGSLSLLAVVMVVEDPGKRGMNPDGSLVPSEKSIAERATAPVSVRSILTDPSFWMLGIIFGLCVAGMKGMLTNLVPLAIDVGIKASTAALLMSIFSLAGLASKLIFAAIADWLSPRLMLAFLIVGFVAGLLCMTLAESGFWVIAVGVSLISMFASMSSPLLSMLLPRIFGQRVVGRVYGMMAVVMLVLSFNAPPAFGRAYDLTGSYDAMFFILAALVAATLLFVPYIRMRPKDIADLVAPVPSAADFPEPEANPAS